MSTIVLNYLTRFAFFQLKGNYFNLELKDLQEAAFGNRHNISEPDVQQKAVGCSCCQWKGKVGESKKAHIQFSGITETELFCPRCNTYMGFVSGNK